MHSQSGGVEAERTGMGPDDAGNPNPVRGGSPWKIQRALRVDFLLVPPIIL
jgi:hypothetical protein